MNSTVRNLIVAVPLATATLILAPGVAQADGSGTISIPSHGDPKPFDLVAPTPVEPTQPTGPDQVSNGKPKPTHPKPNHPQGPGSIANPTPGPSQPHDGPDEITDTPDCTHGCGGEDVPDDKAGPNPQDVPDAPDVDEPTTNEDDEDKSAVQEQEIATPTRIDAGAASETDGGAGLDLSFVLIGGALVTATGAAYAARARIRKGA